MDPESFLADLQRKPDALGRLAEELDKDDPWSAVSLDLANGVDRIVLLGMGSSAYAGAVVAARLRAQGYPVMCELSGSALLPPADPRTLVVLVSASGGSPEVLDAVRRYAGVSPTVGLVNAASSSLHELVDVTVAMHAGDELGGVACRSFQHTLVMLLSLQARLEASEDLRNRLATTVRRCAEATADLLDRRSQWLSEVSELLAGPDGTYIVGPAHRFSSAQQSALMLREGPRRPAVACETSDWSHVDVYLAKSLDYRMLLLPGSAYESELLRWTHERASTVVVTGADRPDVTCSLRYRHDQDDDVRLLTETLVGELVAHDWWTGGSDRTPV